MGDGGRERVVVRLLVRTNEGRVGQVVAVTPERFRKLEGFVENLGPITLPPVEAVVLDDD